MAKVIQHPAFTKAKAKAKRDAEPLRQWTCRVCEHDIGVATSEIMETIIAPMMKGARIIGGTKRKVCAPCHRRGKATEVF
jgi:hypothetical protein